MQRLIGVLNKIIIKLNSAIPIKYIFNTSIIIYVIIFLLRLYVVNENLYTFSDPDSYLISFNFYLDNNYYDILKNGSSYLYNTVAYFFYWFTKNQINAFIITNLLSEILVLVGGVFLLLELNKKVKSKYINIIVLIYAFNILEINAFKRSFNDVFLGVFIVVIMYVVFELIDAKKEEIKLVILAVLCSLTTLIRPTSLVVICLVFFSIIAIAFFRKLNLNAAIKNIIVFTIPLFILTSIFHYPSLKEHRKLGFYNKNFQKDVNWTQRNYLALKKMESGEVPIEKNSIFRRVYFSNVREFLKKNGEQSLPSNSFQFLKKDPFLVFKTVVYNVIFTLIKYFRYYSFLIILPILFLFKKPFLYSYKLPIYMWIFILFLISTICFTLIEYRWFTGYEVLLSAGLLVSLKVLENKDNFKKITQLTVSVSLITISIFNVIMTFVIRPNY